MANEVDFRPLKYLCNGTTRDFPFEWKILSVDEVVVILETIATGEQTTLQFPNDYSVTFESTGGQVTTKTAYASEYDIIISRQSSLYQKKRYSTSTGFQASEVEKSFDEVSMNLQEQAYTLERAIKVPVGSSVLNLNLPLPNAGKTLKWNEEETGLVNSTIDVDELESYAERLYESADNIDIVADNILDVNDVADIMDDVIDVADIKNEVVDVAGIKDNVVAVDNNKNNINAVVSNESNINNVAGNRENINKVADIDDEVIAVADIDDEVVIVAGIDDEVVDVAQNKTNINNCSNNMSSILDAPNQAQTATQQAGIATDKATECLTALAQAESLRESTEIFNFIDCGYLGDTEDAVFDCGTLSDTEDTLLDCGTMENLLLASDDIINVLNLPLLYQQADATDEELARAEGRITQNESDIETINTHLNLNDGEIDSLDDRITECESDIESLADGLDDTNDELDIAKDRITQNENDIDKLQELTDIFNYIECGNTGDIEDAVIDCGTLSDTEGTVIDCLTMSETCVTVENLRDTNYIPYLKAMVEDLKGKLNYALAFIADLQENGIDCGNIIPNAE